MGFSFPVYVLAADSVNVGGFGMLCNEMGGITGIQRFICQPLYGRFLFTEYTVTL